MNLGSVARSDPAPVGCRPVEPSAQRAAGGSVLAGSSSSPAASSAAGRGGVEAGVVAPGRTRAAFRWGERLGAPAVGGRGSRRPAAISWLVPHPARRYPAGGQRRSAQRAARRPGVIALSANGRLVWGPSESPCPTRHWRVSQRRRRCRRRPALAMAHVFRMGPVNHSLLRREQLAAQTMRKSDGRSPARRAPRQVQGPGETQPGERTNTLGQLAGQDLWTLSLRCSACRESSGSRLSSSRGSRAGELGKRKGVDEEAPGPSIMGDFAVGSMQSAQ